MTQRVKSFETKRNFQASPTEPHDSPVPVPLPRLQPGISQS